MSLARNQFTGLETLEGRTFLSTYYVSTSGNDNNPGTSDAPWRTLQRFIAPARPGDTLIVRAGTYAGINASQESDLTFKADPGVVINTAGSSGRDGFNFENCSGMVVDGFTIQPASSQSAWRSGIRFGGGGIGNVARNNKVFMRGQDVQGIFSSFNENQVVENNEVSGNYDAGIYVSNSAVNPTIRNNYVHDLNNSVYGVGLHFNGDASMGGNGLILGGLIEGNKVVNTNTGISMDGMQNAIVRNNLVLGTHGKGINLYAQNAADGCKNTIVVNNTVVLASDGYFTIGVRFGSTNVKVLNNIGIGGSRAMVYDAESASGLVIDYNIYSVTSFSSDNDSSWKNWSAWQSSGRDTHGKQATAASLFVNPSSDYHLLSTAPAVNAGTSLNAPTTDKDGSARPVGGAYDIGAYEYGGVVVTPTPPAAPTNLSATAMAFNQINLAWTDASTDESGFKIERKLGVDGTFAQIATVGAGTTSYNDTTVSGDSLYYYRVRATNSAGDSGYSNTDSALTPTAPTIPNAPTNLAATAMAYNQINLSWTDNSGDETGFKIDRRTGLDGTYSQVATVAAGVTSWIDTTVAGDTTYYYRVRATNAAGDSTYSNTDSALTPSAPTAPAAPSGVSATVAAYNRVNLSWTDNSNNEDGFRVERRIGTGTYALLANVGAGVTSYSDTTASASTQYQYRVRAFNTIGTSTWATSTAVTTPAAPTAPAAPSGLAASAVNDTAIDLTWTDNSNNETGFKIERSTNGTSWAQVGTVGAGVTLFNDTDLLAGTQYTYRVRATNAVGDSAYSATASATTQVTPTAPNAPSSLAASATSDTTIALSWSDNSSNELGFKIERLDAGANFVQVAVVAPNVTSWTDTNLTPGTLYTYRVRANNAVGDSGYSNVAGATTQAAPTAPNAPTGLAAEAASSSAMNLAWTDASDNESGFKIERSTDGTTWSQIAAVAADVNVYQDTGVSANTHYYYRVRATNAVGDSGYSNTADATTPGFNDTTAPTASVVLSNVTDGGDGSYTFTVTYNDDGTVDVSTIDSQDILVSGPNGYSQLATLQSISYAGNGMPVATYRINAPGTAWTNGDNGAYTFTLQGGQVADNAGNMAAETSLGTMNVSVAIPDYAGNSRDTARYLGWYDPERIGVYGDWVNAEDIQDYYKFYLSRDADLALKVTAMTENCNLQLRDADGNLIQISGRDGTNYEYIARRLGAGTYYVRVYNVDGASTAYSLRLASTNPLVEAPNPISGPDYAGGTRKTARKIGNMTDGRVSVYTDLVSPLDVNDFYRFNVNSTMNFTAKLTNLTDDANIQLQDSAGNVIAISGREGTNYELISKTLTKGTYYLRVYSLGLVGTNYSLRVTSTAA